MALSKMEMELERIHALAEARKDQHLSNERRISLLESEIKVVKELVFLIKHQIDNRDLPSHQKTIAGVIVDKEVVEKLKKATGAIKKIRHAIKKR